MNEFNPFEDKVALVDCDSIVYHVGGACDMMEGDATLACKLLDNAINDIEEDTGCTSMEIYLGTESNFRNEIATLLPYKGNRDKSKRPTYYDAIRGRLVSKYGAILCHGEEAEDTVGRRAYEFEDFSKYVVCAIDKDMDMIAGWRYNYRRREFKFIDKISALRSFYLQLVTGDKSVDNIPGLYHHILMDGDYELANKFKYSRYKSKLIKVLDTLVDEDSMWEHVVSIYKEYEQLDKHGITRILEIGKLLWIRRYEGEDWVPLPWRTYDYITDDKREI